MLAKTIIASALMSAAFAAPQPAPEPLVQIIEVRQLISSIVGAATSIVGAAGGNTASIVSQATSLASVVTSRFGSATAAGALSGCTVPSSILAIITDVPVAPANLISALGTVSNVCAKPSFTGSLSSEYDSYSKAASSWAAKNSPALNSWASSYSSNCPIASGLTIASVSLCSTGTAKPSSSGAAGSGTSGSGSASGNGTTTGAGSSNHVVAVGAAMFAGFAGVVAAL